MDGLTPRSRPRDTQHSRRDARTTSLQPSRLRHRSIRSKPSIRNLLASNTIYTLQHKSSHRTSSTYSSNNKTPNEPQSLYTFTTLIFNLIYESTSPSHGGPTSARPSFSYFTVLTYWGLAFYFFIAALHTFTYARTGTPLLTHFPRPLQALHALYYTTITTFPPLVTIVFWSIIFNGWWPDEWHQWSNISQHALNSVFALFEILLTRSNPPLFIHIPFLIFILALYLGLAYLTYDVQHFWVYDFLDPENGRAKVAGYILGIAVGIVIVFLIVRYVIVLRKWVTEIKMDRKGRFCRGRPMAGGDVELEAVRIWEK